MITIARDKEKYKQREACEWGASKLCPIGMLYPVSVETRKHSRTIWIYWKRLGNCAVNGVLQRCELLRV